MELKYKLQIPSSKIQARWYKILVARRIGKCSFFLKPNPKPKETYADVCRKRYRKSYINYNKQFCTEIERLETMQPSAAAAMRFHRMFSITTLWPRLHSKQEIISTIRKIDNILEPSEKRKLQKVMEG